MIEELAKQKYKEFQDAHPEYKDLTWEQLLERQREVFRDDAKRDYIPLIEQWLDSVENPYPNTADWFFLGAEDMRQVLKASLKGG